eukprot:9815665-Alexandrium_andersonii.AAC.1
MVDSAEQCFVLTDGGCDVDRVRRAAAAQSRAALAAAEVSGDLGGGAGSPPRGPHGRHWAGGQGRSALGQPRHPRGRRRDVR